MLRAAIEDPDAVFDMTSTYYVASVSDEVGATDLDDYERDLGLTPVWAEVQDALRSNEALLATGAAPPWTERETAVLRLVRDHEL